MSLKKGIRAKDPRLSIISSEVIRNVPWIESVILCGSRAIIQGIKPSSVLSDYDVAVVMKMPFIPFYLRRIKMVENELSKEFGVKVNLNPLPTFRIRNAKGNLFLFKVKKEGITIWGKDYISMLNSCSIKDIGIDCYFSYFFSLMKELVRSFDLSFMHEFSDRNSGQLTYGAAKALLGCGELLLLLRGNYESKPNAVVSKVGECGLGGEIGNVGFLEDLRVASMVKENPFAEVEDPLRFWFSTRNCLLEMFRLLMRGFFNLDSVDFDELIMEYLRVGRGVSPLKNVEYSALTLLMKREFFPKALLSRLSVVDRVRVALIWLLASINEDGSFCRETLEKAYRILKGYMKVPHSKNDINFWRNVRYAICTYWPYACIVMGI